MKSKFLKMAVVVAAALALVNCGDESNPANPDQNPIGELSSSSDVTGTPDVGVSSSSEIAGPIAGISSSSEIAGPVAGVSSSSENVAGPVAASSSSVKPVAASSSSVAAPKSSSSEKVIPSSSSAAPKGIFLAADTDENQNYMEIEYKEGTGPDRAAILSYPKRLSDTQKHGIVIWGPGGGDVPKSYEGMIRRLASHGFVVLAYSSSPGNGNNAKAALDWLEQQAKDSNSPLYNKLDFTKVGASGHSMGGLESEQILIKDSRVITAVMNNSGDLGGGAAQYVPQGKTIAIVYGEVGSEAPNAERDYATNVKVPACLLKMEHNNYGHGSGPWDGQGATVAWMRWHLGGEDFRKADFVGTTGKYIDGSVMTWQGARGNWKGQCKNF